MDNYEFFTGQWPWQQAVDRQQANFQEQAASHTYAAAQAYLNAIGDQHAYAAIQDGAAANYVRQAMDRYRRAPNVSQGWLDAMLDIELGLFEP
jgi:hypothetical protein